jgi:hypothetical protein
VAQVVQVVPSLQARQFELIDVHELHVKGLAVEM